MSHSTDTGTEVEAGKKFRMKENRRGTTKLESRDVLCISMEGKDQIDAHRLLDMLSSIGFRWGSGHELWEHPEHRLVLSRSHWMFLHLRHWYSSLGSVDYCKNARKDVTITLDHLDVLIEDFVYEHQS